MFLPFVVREWLVFPVLDFLSQFLMRLQSFIFHMKGLVGIHLEEFPIVIHLYFLCFHLSLKRLSL